MTHPARYSPEVVDTIHDILRPMLMGTWGPRRLHDPFAGTGERLADLAGRFYGTVTYSGTEIEPEFIEVHVTALGHIFEGDATDPDTYPRESYIIVTSPPYPNGMSDSWAAQDPSKRKNYRAALKEITGEDRQLHDNNMGRYGYRNTAATSKKRQEYWRIARETVGCWDGVWGARAVIVNVSDFIYSKRGVDHTEPVVAEWDNLLKEHGWQTYRVPVGTRRMRHGANSEKRVPAEWILVGSKK